VSFSNNNNLCRTQFINKGVISTLVLVKNGYLYVILFRFLNETISVCYNELLGVNIIFPKNIIMSTPGRGYPRPGLNIHAGGGYPHRAVDIHAVLGWTSTLGGGYPCPGVEIHSRQGHWKKVMSTPR
jgi:hypothetical protein